MTILRINFEAPPRPAKSEAAFLFGDMGKRKLTEKLLAEILELIAGGQSLRSICDHNKQYPSWRTFLQYVRDDDEIYARYRKARIDQAESLRDYLIELTQRPLPADKQMANAEVQRRKLEADVINRTIGAAQAKGLRDKQEDQVEKPTTLTIRWGDDGAAEVTTEDNNGLGKASVPQRSAREPLH
jgi:hypothetical protein